MVRAGERVLCVPVGENGDTWYVLGARTPKIGDRVLMIPSPDGKSYHILKPYNAYQDDRCITLPLRNGRDGVCIAGEPPNYLSPTWTGGFPMSCQQGSPATSGWSCSGSCPINPSTHPTARETCKRAYGLPLLWTDANACTHSLGSGSWKANKTYHWDATLDYYGCRSRCYQEYEQYDGGTYKEYCKLYGTETVIAHQMSNGAVSGTAYPRGCYKTSNRYVKRIWKAAVFDGQLVDAFYSYACNGPNTVCPRFNGGAGTPFPTCRIKGGGDKGPSFSPGQKPSGCAYPGYLGFDGWSVPGGESNSGTGCVLSKASEGARNESDGNIRCKFMSPVGTVADMYGSGDVHLPLSPANTGGFGKAGSNLGVNANISIGGSTSGDYTRIPPRQINSGNVKCGTIGRW